MLRNILITAGLLVALDPYLGFPQSIDKFIITILGFFIVFVLIITRRGRLHYDSVSSDSAQPKILHVERTEVEDSPKMHIERTTTLDTEEIESNSGEQVMTEKKTTVVRRRKRKPATTNEPPASVQGDFAVE